jgi:hypothetical protein
LLASFEVNWIVALLKPILNAEISLIVGAGAVLKVISWLEPVLPSSSVHLALK